MQKSKLFSLLKMLSREELPWFYKFIQSPYYNSNDHLVRLFEILRKYHPHFSSNKLEAEKLFKILLPEQKFDLQRLRLLMHRLSELVEQFLVAEQIKLDTFQQQKILVREFGRRNNYKPFEKGSLQLLKELEKSPFRNVRYFKEKQSINQQWYAHPQTNKEVTDLKSIETAMEALDLQYIINKLQLTAALKARETILSDTYKIWALDWIKEHISEIHLKESPLIEIYLNILKLITKEEEEQTYTNTRKQFVENIEYIDSSDRKYVLKTLINYIVSKLNEGDINLLKELFELYKMGLSFQIILENDRIEEIDYTNIVIIGSQLKEFEWTQAFIHDFKKYLPTDHQEDLYFYSLASLQFSQDNYSQTIDHLLNHHFSTIQQNLKAKTLLIKTYFELFIQDDSYDELLLSHLNAFEKMLRRKKIISGVKKKNYLNFAIYCRKLLRLKLEKKPTTNLLITLKENSFVNKNWLLQKAQNNLDPK